MINAKNMQAILEFARKHGTLDVALLAMGDEITVTVNARVNEDHDPTAHAPILALRELGALTHETSFHGYNLYTPAEPCPMCAAACLEAGLEGIYFGLPDPERREALRVDALAHAYGLKTHVQGGIQLDACRQLHDELKS